MDDALHCREADAGPLERVRGMKALKDAEELVHILHVEAHTVVTDKYHRLGAVRITHTDLDLGARPRARELEGIGDEVDQNDLEHGPVPVDLGQCANIPRDVAALQ